MKKNIETSIHCFLEEEFPRLEKKRSAGWYITYIAPASEGRYTVVLERCTPAVGNNILYIPPRKKIKFI